MKNIRIFLSENSVLGVKFSIYLNRHVFVMLKMLSAEIFTQYARC